MIRQGSLDDINTQQFLKISNYEDTVRQLDIYYAIGLLNFTNLNLKNVSNLLNMNTLFGDSAIEASNVSMKL